MIADGLVVGKDEEEEHDEFKETKVEDVGGDETEDDEPYASSSEGEETS